MCRVRRESFVVGDLSACDGVHGLCFRRPSRIRIREWFGFAFGWLCLRRPTALERGTLIKAAPLRVQKRGHYFSGVLARVDMVRLICVGCSVEGREGGDARGQTSVYRAVGG